MSNLFEKRFVKLLEDMAAGGEGSEASYADKTWIKE